MPQEEDAVPPARPLHGAASANEHETDQARAYHTDEKARAHLAPRRPLSRHHYKRAGSPGAMTHETLQARSAAQENTQTMSKRDAGGTPGAEGTRSRQPQDGNEAGLCVVSVRARKCVTAL